MTVLEIVFPISLTIAGMIGGIALHRFVDNLGLPKIIRERRSELNRKWQGVFRQSHTDTRMATEIPVTVELKAGSRVVTGSMIAIDDVEFHFSVRGSFHNERFLRLEYNAVGESAGAFDLGVMFLTLADQPNKLTGRLVGYGSLSTSVITSDVELFPDTQGGSQ